MYVHEYCPKGLKVVIFGLLVICCHACAYPQHSRQPNLEYELISGGMQSGPKPIIMPVTRKPLIINTPPPVDPNSKTFAYNPKSKTWTLVKKNDPAPAEDTLLWNQSNDKWLTQVARI